MAEAAGTIERVATELARVLTRITNKLGDDAVLDTFEHLGVRFPAELLTEPTITAARSTIYTVCAELRPLIQSLTGAIDAGDSAAVAAASFALVTQCGRVAPAIPELANALSIAGPTLPGITASQIGELTGDLPRKLIDLVLADLLELSAPAGAVLQVLGILERTFVPGVLGDPTRPEHEQVHVHLDRLLPAITDPAGHLASLYGWGTPAFDATRLLSVLEAVIGGLGLPVLLTPGTATEPPRLQVFAFDLEPTADGAGLKLDVLLPGALTTQFPFPVSPPTWTAQVSVSGSLPSGAGGEIRPPLEISLTPPAGELTGSVTVGLRAAPPTPFLLLGSAGGSRLELDKLGLDAGLALRFDPATGKARGGLVADGEITGGRLIIDTSGGDGFISAVLGAVRLQSEFGVGFTFTPRDGLRFQGSAGLEIQIPTHVQLGPIEIQAVYLLARLAKGALPIEVSAAFSARLGPIQASVDRIGVRADLTFPAGGGNLGPANLALGFKPPRGAGLAIDVGVIKGGGFLNFDPARGEYDGALELEFAEFLALKVIGLITTRMPDGSSGFSLLLIITTEFPGGLQLGYGFTLLGVGGLIGLNRTMRLSALMEGVRTGAVESVMFPRDIVANAPRILSDLKELFPPQPGTFLIGPMAKIGWGTPTLISVAVGVIIEIPGNVAIVGVAKVALPTEDQPILLLQVNFAGAIEFDRKQIYFFASLFESRVLDLTLDGELGLLMAYGDEPNFVLSVGGFHPGYTPPPLPFPTPQRVAINLLNTEDARIGLSGYFAITSNTVQFGANAEVYFRLTTCSVDGHLEFDALFRLSPFSFTAHTTGWLSLNAFGVGLYSVFLQFSLKGPTPWRARGTGSVSLLLLEVSADFDETWGEERDTTLPSISVLPLLAAELAKREVWRTKAPDGGKPLVTLRALPEAERELVLHPLGTLFVVQRAVPLDIRLDKIGAQPVDDVSRCTIEVAEVAGSGPIKPGLVKRSDAQEMFALAQFQNMDDAALLSRPGFEREHAGLELGSDGTALASQRATRRSTRYEAIVIDPIARQVTRFASYNTALFHHFLRGASVSRSPLSSAEAALRQPYAETIKVTGDSYAVASTRDNTAAGPSFTSQAQAQDYLAGRLADDPRLGDSLHVIPTTEVAA